MICIWLTMAVILVMMILSNRRDVARSTHPSSKARLRRWKGQLFGIWFPPIQGAPIGAAITGLVDTRRWRR